MEIVSHEDAAEAGATMFFTGLPCKRGHVDLRYVKSRDCVVCSRQRYAEWLTSNADRARSTAKKWREANRERLQAIDKAQYRDNPEYYKRKAREWQAANKDRHSALGKARYEARREELLEGMKKWARENPERRRAHSRKYGATRRRNVESQLESLSNVELLEITVLYEEAAMLGSDWHVDHITPLSVGGEHRPYNMQIVKANYNKWKRAQILYAPEDIGKYMPEHYKVAA
jgi:hypothetical protein